MEIINTQTLIFIGGIIVGFSFYWILDFLFNLNKKNTERIENSTEDLAKYKLALDSASNHVIITDSEGVILYANKAAEKTTGFVFSEMQGKTPNLWGKQMSAEFYKNLWDTIKNKKAIFSGEIINKRKNGEIYTAIANISPILKDNFELIGFVGIEEDITDRKNKEKQLKKMNDLMIGRELKMIELKKELQKYDIKK